MREGEPLQKPEMMCVVASVVHGLVSSLSQGLPEAEGLRLASKDLERYVAWWCGPGPMGGSHNRGDDFIIHGYRAEMHRELLPVKPSVDGLPAVQEVPKSNALIEAVRGFMALGILVKDGVTGALSPAGVFIPVFVVPPGTLEPKKYPDGA
jgi:hypothetical protein